MAELTAAGCDLVAAHLEIAGSVPRGSGLSSSAALEVALCLALLAVSGADVPRRLALAQICSRVENDWVGARTGLLDQLASLYGETDRALSIDFQSLEVAPVPLELDGYSLITVDSGQRHSNAGADGDAAPAGYNRRRAECARACELLEIDSLRRPRSRWPVVSLSHWRPGPGTCSPKTSACGRRWPRCRVGTWSAWESS